MDSSPRHDTTSDATAMDPSQRLSADEMGLYDRQIRLWGAAAQQRIRSAHILLISLRALGTEIAKNLTLAGISSLAIVDDGLVVAEDLGAQYFLRDEDIGKPRAEAAIPRIQELNPRVAVKAEGSLQTLLQQNQDYYKQFSCVICCDHGFETLSGINTAARFAQTPFYAAGIHGLYGYIFADLVEHGFVTEREKPNISTSVTAETMTRRVTDVSERKESDGKAIEMVIKKEVYCPLLLANTARLPPDLLRSSRKLKAVTPLLPCLRALFDFQRSNNPSPGNNEADLATFAKLANDKALELQLPPEHLTQDLLRNFISSIGAEIVPTAAFVGGRLSEDVINVLGGKEQPIQNFAIFDGEALSGQIYCLYSPPPEQLGVQLPETGVTVPFAANRDAANGSVGTVSNGVSV